VTLNIMFWNDSDGRSIRISPVVIWLAGPPTWMWWKVELEASAVIITTNRQDRCRASSVMVAYI